MLTAVSNNIFDCENISSYIWKALKIFVQSKNEEIPVYFYYLELVTEGLGKSKKTTDPHTKNKIIWNYGDKFSPKTHFIFNNRNEKSILVFKTYPTPSFRPSQHNI